jgi:uncharacterized protein DUF1761
MQELTTGVSWSGVIVGAIAAFIVGWLWYSPMLFGKKWAEGLGIEMGTASEMPMVAMLAQAIGLFLMSWFVGVTAVNNALLTVILATVAFIVLAGSGAMFAKQNAYVRYVNAGYWAVSLVVMIVSQGIFRGMAGA